MVSTFIGMSVQLFHVSAVIITLQLSKPWSVLEVLFLKITAFDRIKGWLQNVT